MKRYIIIWYKAMIAYAQIAFASRLGVILFTIGKLLRFAFFLIFLLLIGSRTQEVGGYTLWEIIFFFATFNLIDLVPQMFFRSVYMFRHQVVSGNFDFYLIQPISALLRPLFGASDILDFPMLILTIGFLLYSGSQLPFFSITGVFLYLLLVINALIIATAFHICVLSVGVVSTEVDNTIMLYRDLTQMGRVPVSIYAASISFILTFVIPIGIMMTFPVQALIGALSIQFIMYSFLFGIIFLVLSLFAWNRAIRHYSSASS